jgi:hypothetical protein
MSEQDLKRQINKLFLTEPYEHKEWGETTYEHWGDYFRRYYFPKSDISIFVKTKYNISFFMKDRWEVTVGYIGKGKLSPKTKDDKYKSGDFFSIDTKTIEFGVNEPISKVITKQEIAYNKELAISTEVANNKTIDKFLGVFDASRSGSRSSKS